MNKGYPGVAESLPNEKDHRRAIAQTLNNTIQGKLNAVTSITLAVSATTTTITDKRIGANTWIGLQPTTADAAAALSTTYVSAQTNGSATLTHTSAATADRTFAVLLIG